ncbi:translocon-associated protein subunit gamma [Oratosquilla oratoria]|uniref:translocon-associated protein subunit gamma n=1 Tax=Oratosquilla oratoria TaxID=337810 RepID=UPI003F77219F
MVKVSGDGREGRYYSLKMVNKGKLTREEELLLQDFSRNVSKKSSVIFYFNAFIVSAIPIWLYWRIHMMDPVSSAVLFAVVTAVATYLVARAYKNTKFVLKHKVAQKVEEAVTREVLKHLADDKKMSKKEKDERVLWKKNEVADSEATTFSLFYNNALFLMLVILGSFLIFRSFAPAYNYTLSTLGAAGIIALFSTGSQ